MKPFKLITITVTLFSFLFTILPFDVVHATAISTSPAFDIKNISVPYRFGEIKDAFTGTNGKTIIHIQDAHCDYSAQHSIEAIINHLVNAHKDIGLISLEGGKGRYDISIFTKIANPELRKRVGDYFVKEGRLCGPEFYAIKNPGKAELFGIEDASLYFENLNAYRASLSYKGEADRGLNSLSLAIAKLKRKIYSPELKDLDDEMRAYKDDKIDFAKYVSFLMENARVNRIDIKRFASFFMLAAVLDEEKSININDADCERNALIDRLGRKLSRKDLEELAIKTVQFKQGDLSNESFYRYLFKKARVVGVDFNKLPNLVRYSAYVNKYEAIDKAALHKDIADLEAVLIADVAKTDVERTLYYLDRDLSVLKGIFNVALTKEEFDRYLANKDNFCMKRFVDFINMKAPLHGFNFKIDDSVMRMDSYRDDMEKFYILSQKRDGAFIKNIEYKLKRDKKNVTILVTGGFHTDNLSKLFKDRGYSYVGVMPKFKKASAVNPYFRVLSGGKSGIETIIESCVSNIAVPAMNSEIVTILSGMGIDGTKDRDRYRLAVDVMAALMNDRKEGIVLTVPGGRLRLTFEDPPKGSFSERVGTVDGQVLFAVRQPDESYNRTSKNNTMFNRAIREEKEGHQAPWDLLFKMAHTPGYAGHEKNTDDLVDTPGKITAILSEIEARIGGRDRAAGDMPREEPATAAGILSADAIPHTFNFQLKPGESFGSGKKHAIRFEWPIAPAPDTKKGEGATDEIASSVRSAINIKVSSLDSTTLDISYYGEAQNVDAPKHLSVRIGYSWPHVSIYYRSKQRSKLVTDSREVLQIVGAIERRMMGMADVSKFLTRFRGSVALDERYRSAKTALGSIEPGRVEYGQGRAEYESAKRALVGFLDAAMDPEGRLLKRAISVGIIQRITKEEGEKNEIEEEREINVDQVWDGPGLSAVPAPATYHGYVTILVDSRLLEQERLSRLLRARRLLDNYLWITVDIGELLARLLASGFTPYSFAEGFDIKEAGSSMQSDLVIYPAIDEKGEMDARGVFVNTARFEDGKVVRKESFVKVELPLKVVGMDDGSEWLTEGPPSTTASDSYSDWIGMMEAVYRQIVGLSERNVPGAGAGMINIITSDEFAGTGYEQYGSSATDAVSEVRKLLKSLGWGNIDVNLFKDDEDGRRRLEEAIDNSGIEDKQERIITFAYQKGDRDAALEAISYVVYMTGEKGRTATPIGMCGLAGLEYLNRSDLIARENRDAEHAAEFVGPINESTERFVQGLAAMSGDNVYEAMLDEVAKKDESGIRQLSSTGSISVKIMPIRTQELVGFHTRDAVVLRSV